MPLLRYSFNYAFSEWEEECNYEKKVTGISHHLTLTEHELC